MLIHVVVLLWWFCAICGNFAMTLCLKFLHHFDCGSFAGAPMFFVRPLTSVTAVTLDSTQLTNPFGYVATNAESLATLNAVQHAYLHRLLVDALGDNARFSVWVDILQPCSDEQKTFRAKEPQQSRVNIVPQLL